MGFQSFNPNKFGRNVGDCAVRAISAALNIDWETAYVALCLEGFRSGDMPSANASWGAYLRRNGFRKYSLPDSCVDEYTVGEFALDHPDGTYVLALSGHVVCVKNGEILDTWNSENEIVIYYFSNEGGTE